MTVLHNGNIGIGTTRPLAKLHVQDSSVLFTGAYSPNNPGNPPIEGDGARMMWYADKAAFRVGFAADGSWDKDNIGNGSVAMGSKTRASAYQSFAMGFKSWATGPISTAIGTGAHALASYSTAVGWGPSASGVGSAAIGLATTAKAFAAVSLGIWNDNSDNPDSILPRPNDRIFQIGNGEILFSNNNYVLGSQGNAMTVLRNGNVGIGTVRPNQKLVVNGNICATGTITTCSDIRYKQNFSPIAHSLSSILSLHGLYYYWKKNEFPQMEFADARQVGFSAQEVEKLFPEIVVTDASGYKSMDYGRLTPVLVEAIKEQQEQINTMQQQIDDLKKLIGKLIK